MGNELDLNEGETLVYLMKFDDNEHWWLADDGMGQVGYVPSVYLMITIDETLLEEDSDTTRKKDKETGLTEPRMERRWDMLEKEERRTQR